MWVSWYDGREFEPRPWQKTCYWKKCHFREKIYFFASNHQNTIQDIKSGTEVDITSSEYIKSGTEVEFTSSECIKSGTEVDITSSECIKSGTEVNIILAPYRVRPIRKGLLISVEGFWPKQSLSECDFFWEKNVMVRSASTAISKPWSYLTCLELFWVSKNPIYMVRVLFFEFWPQVYDYCKTHK